jgi:hypothetical protein
MVKELRSLCLNVALEQSEAVDDNEENTEAA